MFPENFFNLMRYHNHFSKRVFKGKKQITGYKKPKKETWTTGRLRWYVAIFRFVSCDIWRSFTLVWYLKNRFLIDSIFWYLHIIPMNGYRIHQAPLWLATLIHKMICQTATHDQKLRKLEPHQYIHRNWYT